MKLEKWLMSLVISVLPIGCATSRLEKEIDKNNMMYEKETKLDLNFIYVPTILGVGFFGGIATHQLGHTVVAYSLGAKSVDVDVVPGHNYGNFHYEYTKYSAEKEFNIDSLK